MICAKRRNFAFWANFFRKYPEICQKMSVVSGKRVYPFGKKSFFGVEGTEDLAKSKNYDRTLFFEIPKNEDVNFSITLHL